MPSQTVCIHYVCVVVVDITAIKLILQTRPVVICSLLSTIVTATLEQGGSI